MDGVPTLPPWQRVWKKLAECGRAVHSTPLHFSHVTLLAFFAPGSLRRGKRQSVATALAVRDVPVVSPAFFAPQVHASANSVFVPSSFLSTCCRSCFTLPTLMQPSPVYLRLVQPGQAGLHPFHTSTVRRIRDLIACKTKIATTITPSKAETLYRLKPGISIMRLL